MNDCDHYHYGMSSIRAFHSGSAGTSDERQALIEKALDRLIDQGQLLGILYGLLCSNMSTAHLSATKYMVFHHSVSGQNIDRFEAKVVVSELHLIGTLIRKDHENVYMTYADIVKDFLMQRLHRTYPPILGQEGLGQVWLMVTLRWIATTLENHPSEDLRNQVSDFVQLLILDSAELI